MKASLFASLILFIIFAGVVIFAQRPVANDSDLPIYKIEPTTTITAKPSL